MPITILGTTLYSLTEAAAMMNVTPRTIQNYISQRRLIGQKIGGGWRFTEEAIQAFVRGEEQPAAKAERA